MILMSPYSKTANTAGQPFPSLSRFANSIDKPIQNLFPKNKMENIIASKWSVLYGGNRK
jgi:hypothetical protein